MTISERSQLGVRFITEKEVKARCLTAIQKSFQDRLEKQEANLAAVDESIQRIKEDKALESDLDENFVLPYNDAAKWESKEVDFGSIDRMFCMGGVGEKDIKWFLIQESVFKAAELIKIGENFDCFMLRRIRPGDYMYLLGKTRMVKFIVVEDGIKGIWWDDSQDKIFEWAINFKKNKFFYYAGYEKEFSQVMQLLTFIELGDIEVTILSSLQKIKAEKKENDIYNGSKNTVYIVDSSWNKMIIRTEGFAVRGHFRLQPCGEGMRDRKLLWINAFEKNGYIRRPKAEIIKK